jgi:hypothetical protein
LIDVNLPIAIIWNRDLADAVDPLHNVALPTGMEAHEESVRTRRLAFFSFSLLSLTSAAADRRRRARSL